jgi:hypothetical protein
MARTVQIGKKGAGAAELQHQLDQRAHNGNRRDASEPQYDKPADFLPGWALVITHQ